MATSKKIGNKLARRLGRTLFVLLVLHFIVEATGHHYLYTTLANTVFKGRLGPGIEEYKEMPNREVLAYHAQPWAVSPNYNQGSFSAEEEAYHNEFGSVSFVVVHKDKLLFEKYWDGFDDSSISNSFSMAKSIIGALTGVAIKKGLIESVDQPISRFLPQYGEGLGEKVTVENLLTMSSGVEFDENYINPFSFPARANYGDNLELLLTNYKVTEVPGVYFDYQSGTTQILAELLMNAGRDNLSSLAHDWIWDKIGAEHTALWSMDRENGEEKAFCCFNATAKDFARMGKLYLHYGNWEGEQLIDSAYVAASTQPADLIDLQKDEKNERYGYSWWTGVHKGMPFFFMRGILGQYVLVLPEKELIVVRMGRKRDKGRNDPHPDDVFNYLDMGLKLISE